MENKLEKDDVIYSIDNFDEVLLIDKVTTNYAYAGKIQLRRVASRNKDGVYIFTSTSGIDYIKTLRKKNIILSHLKLVQYFSTFDYETLSIKQLKALKAVLDTF